MTAMFVVFDLDGTLALTKHREHFLKSDPKDWRGFYAACDMDAPCTPLIETLRALAAAGHRVEIWSGRSDEVWPKTVAWLKKHGLVGFSVRCRNADDHQPDTKLKAAWLDACETPPDLVFEDRASMVAMYRDRGIVCAQVAPGNF
jgi:phosphoglycolate phosphatase-like HAD superfamily hydrolase